MKRIWKLQQSTEPNTLDLYIYGNVEGDSVDWWTGEEIQSETSAKHFRDELAKHPDVTQINIYINSYGGSVFEGTAIYSQLKRHPANKTVYIDGFACSVAAVIAMAGDQVIMPGNTMMMIHNAWMCICGNSKELRKAADDLDIIMEANRQAFLEKSNGKITEEELIELMEAESWLTAKQCLEYGFCDEVQGREVDMTDAKQMLQKVNDSLERKLSFNKAIAAQIRELIQKQNGQASPEPEPAAEPAVQPAEPQQADEPPVQDPPAQEREKVLKFINALMGGKEG